MNDLIQEIEDDIRRERFDKLWYRVGSMLAGISVCVIAATVVVVLWQNHAQNVAHERTSQFISGLERMNAEDYNGAIAIFSALAVDENSTYYGLAMLRKAQAQLLIGDKDAALKTYQALAKKSDAFGEMAELMTAGDDLLPAPASGAPLYYSLNELRGWQLLKMGKKDEAVALFLSIRDSQTAPLSMRQRLAEALWHIAPDRIGGSAK